MPLRALLLLLPAVAFAAPAGAQAPPLPCTSAASSIDGLAEVACDYDGAGLAARVLDLFRLRDGGLTIDAVERAFGVPRLGASYADPWNADYGVLLRPAPGRGDWQVLLNFEESFGPGLPGRRHYLRGTVRPERIDPRLRGEMRLDLMLGGERAPAAGAPECLPPERLAAEGVRREWRRRPPEPVMISHGGPIWNLVLRRGGLAFSTDVTASPPCARQIELTQETNAPPEPNLGRLRAAELRRISVERADRMAAAIARPGDPEEDPDALRAYARFVRDGYLRFDAAEGNPGRDIDREIQAMGEAEARALASRLANGHPWGVAREDCEAAIGEEDAPAALERRARRRGLGAPEIAALRVQCLAFLEGRRFRYRPRAPTAPGN
ncbi:MAG: hypothetical protein QOI38_3011 [Sphingomonadales bacterium]|jgi:broad specificity phosphatase PhoE|nr:hypothetical protein [Sphingomonadales bacterium]